jgi:hypothetical protein
VSRLPSPSTATQCLHDPPRAPARAHEVADLTYSREALRLNPVSAGYMANMSTPSEPLPRPHLDDDETEIEPERSPAPPDETADDAVNVPWQRSALSLAAAKRPEYWLG